MLYYTALCVAPAKSRAYVDAMIRWLALLLSILATPASAMNWEGHDDWTDTFAPGLVFEQAVPEARPLPSPRCPVSPEQSASNPYEQIPLPRHGCAAKPGINSDRR